VAFCILFLITVSFYYAVRLCAKYCITLSVFALDYDDPHTLVVLVEEEIIFIDLRSEGWPVFRAPYLATLHSSAITCSAHVTNVPKTIWTKLSEAGNQQMALGYSREVIICICFC